MKFLTTALLYSIFLMQNSIAISQQIKFTLVSDAAPFQWGGIRNMAQDNQGYIWFSTFKNGFYQYDGSAFKGFTNNSKTQNSLSDNKTSCLIIDKSGIIWIGTFNAGVDRFDPATNTFTHYRHNPGDVSTLINDSVNTLLEDYLGGIWIGTVGGLDRLDTKAGKFTHYMHAENDPSSITHNSVFTLYEDKQKTLWVGCGSISETAVRNKTGGGLNCFNRNTGKFTRYKHNPADTASLAGNMIFAIFEDSKKNFWIGTDGDGLQTLDRLTGKFTHYRYDDAHPEKLSRPPLISGQYEIWNIVSLITEDSTGAIWIGSILQGINRYDPVLKKITHYGSLQIGNDTKSDTVSGFSGDINNTPLTSIISADGLMWIGTNGGDLFKISQNAVTIPYFTNNVSNNSFVEGKDGILWIATGNGLLKHNRKTGSEKIFLNDSANINSPSGNNITAIREDNQGNYWLGILDDGGLNKFDPVKNIFTRYKHDPQNSNSLPGDSLNCLHIDRNENLWVGILNRGVDKMDLKTGKFTHYLYNKNDSTAIISDNVSCIESSDKEIWMGTYKGIDRLDLATNQFHHYLHQTEILSICIDAAGETWIGTQEGLYLFNRQKDIFLKQFDLNLSERIRQVLHILEDNQHNLWLSTGGSMIKINPERNAIRIFGKNYGIHANTFYLSDNVKSKTGELFIGDQGGYYTLFPDQFREIYPPKVHITSFKIADEEIIPQAGGIINKPIWNVNEIRLNHNQKNFSFDFKAIDYRNTGDLKYLFMLENYDNSWHDLGADHKAYFFNVDPGTYIFRVKAINSEGIQDEKSISIIISPPWWRTWWAYTLLTLAFITIISGYIYYRSAALRRENKILEEKVIHRTAELNQSLKELKSTQAQLIQSEKMASLGQLTAGIAHEIQNPLNFVNNFSEVNKEMLEELKAERLKPKAERDDNLQDDLINDVIANEEKINHHGKRADNIVKGMLQHSRSSTGIKEPTNINSLADEYLRLAYQGLRAKDKSFNATMKTGFDSSIGNINIIPQDIGRVLLNLYNNAFYAVNEKKKQEGNGFEPTVSIRTKKLIDKIEIRVNDNGNGITQKIVDKIFQPFFTTKPTGQGTGLGLSMAYDIVKAHGGEIKVESKGGEGSEFIIELPISNDAK